MKNDIAIDGPALLMKSALSFDPGDKLNGSLYLCDPTGGERGAAVAAAIETLRAAGLWSAQAPRQVQDDQRPAYAAQLVFVEAREVGRNESALILARFDHPKFPSSAERFGAWKASLGSTPVS